MVLLNSLLFVLTAAFIASTYHFYKEKRLLREFIRSSRRHRYHQEMDGARRQKANRYMTLSVILFIIALPLLVENLIENFLEDNWKWLLPVIGLSVFLLVFRSYSNNRNYRMTKSLVMGFENANNS
ncbi:MAG TPA: hypothetical protein VI385_10425 [Flavisolibacter sp.]